MRRAASAVAGTAAGLLALIGYKSGPVPHTAVAVGGLTTTTVPAAGAPAPTVPGATVTTAAVAVTTTVPPTTVAPAPGAGVSPATTPPTTAAPRPVVTAPPPPAPPTTAGGGLGRDGTYPGPVVSNRWGPVQVQAVIQGGRLVDVQALQLPFDHYRSKELSDRTAPVLRQEALAAQSAQIDTVSGATYTSDGYRQSLQAALDAAKH